MCFNFWFLLWIYFKWFLKSSEYLDSEWIYVDSLRNKMIIIYMPQKITV